MSRATGTSGGRPRIWMLSRPTRPSTRPPSRRAPGRPPAMPQFLPGRIRLGTASIGAIPTSTGVSRRFRNTSVSAGTGPSASRRTSGSAPPRTTIVASTSSTRAGSWRRRAATRRSSVSAVAIRPTVRVGMVARHRSASARRSIGSTRASAGTAVGRSSTSTWERVASIGSFGGGRARGKRSTRPSSRSSTTWSPTSPTGRRRASCGTTSAGRTPDGSLG